MKKFYKVFSEFMPKYKGLILVNILFIIIFSFFSMVQFLSLKPVVEILFQNKFFPTIEPNIHFSITNFGWIKDFFYYHIGVFIQEHGKLNILFLFCGFILLMSLFKTLFSYLASIALVTVKTGIVRDLRLKIFSKLLTLPLSYFSKNRKGDIIHRMTTDVVLIQTILSNSIQLIFKHPIIIVISIFTMFCLNVELSIFVTIFLPISAFILGRVGRMLRKNTYEIRKKEGEILSRVEETISGLKIIKYYNAEKNVSNLFSEIVDKTRTTELKVEKRYLISMPLAHLLTNTMMIVIILYGGSLVISGNSNLDIGTFCVFFGLIYSLITPLKQMSRLTYSLKKGLASVDRINDILNSQNDINEADRAMDLLKLKDSIEYKNVSFKYNSDYVLKNISLTIKKGESIGIIGRSGSGKSTFIDLLTRFHDVSEGEIIVDGNNIKDYKIRDLRSLAGTVYQDTILFNDSFANNIMYSKPNSTAKEIIEAAKIANAHSFIMNSQHGYNTNIGEDGRNLSVGQKQRISIARAILSNSPVMIFDEATSSLDSESEYLVNDAVNNLLKNRTSIIISHKLSIIKKCDTIYLFHNGEIIERGTHNQLIGLNKEYNKLFELQKNGS